MEDTLTFDPIYLCIENFTLLPYVRMTRKSLHVDKYAQRYLSNQSELRILMQSRLEKSERVVFGKTYIPDRTPFQLVMLVNTLNDNHHCDLDNLVKAVLDASSGLIFKDDRYCDQITARRYFNVYDQNLILLAVSGIDDDPLDLIDNLYAYPLLFVNAGSAPHLLTVRKTISPQIKE